MVDVQFRFYFVGNDTVEEKEVVAVVGGGFLVSEV